MSSQVLEAIHVGVVGACGRGGSFRRVFDALPKMRIHAVCDLNVEGLAQAQRDLGASEAYVDYGEMIARSELDAVIIGTPMPLHVPQAIAALDAGLHVLSEVPAGVSIAECRQLVAACRRSQAHYVMAENYIYARPVVMVQAMVRRGLFGQVYYAEGEYLHELKQLNEDTPWRRRWQTGIDGVTYGTHSLGPILQWMAGDRVARVCCAGSGHHYCDPRGDLYENQDSTVMLCQMESGSLAKIRVDMLSNRPHAMHNHVLQGTEGAFESARTPDGVDRVWLASRSGDANAWLPLASLEDQFLPDLWREQAQAAQRAGHGGGDYYEMFEFLQVILGERQPTVGIHQALDMTLPGLMSQQSIREGGAWLPVPDSRTW